MVKRQRLFKKVVIGGSSSLMPWYQ